VFFILISVFGDSLAIFSQVGRFHNRPKMQGGFGIDSLQWSLHLSQMEGRVKSVP
jgi:hypothetical protein